MGGRAELQASPPPSAPIPNEDTYRQRIRAFIENLRPSATPAMPEPGFVDIALRSMETMQNTIARFKLAAYSPDVTIDIPRNACRMHEFWRAEELISLGRERTAHAFGTRATDIEQTPEQ